MADGTEATGKRGFLAELSRRHVWRAAVLYAGAVWALSQGIAQLGPLFHTPEWAMRWFVIACAIGFPFWIVFAWFYAWTPEGFRREAEVERTPALTHATGRKLDFAIIGVLAVAVALLASGYFVKRGARINANGTAIAAFNPPANTLVVLPFANLSGDKGQQYFSDGITEELTNALGQATDLKVIAWDTASHYRDSQQPAIAIGKTLGVANVLTGRILRQGNQVRVIVELVNARTGYQVWSNHYDDSLANIFQVQDQISAAIAVALKVRLASSGPARTVNPAAHDLVLQARALTDKALTAAPYEQAGRILEQAIALAPDYADAHATLARTWFDLTQYSSLPLKDAVPKVRDEARKALTLDPRNVEALVALGNADSSDGHVAEATAEYVRALEIDPSNADAHLDYGNALPLKQAEAQERDAAQLDPESATAQNNLAAYELDLGNYQQALTSDLALMRLDPRGPDNALGLAEDYALLHRDQDAVRAFDLARPDTPLAKALIGAGRLTYQSRLDPKLHAQALAGVEALRRRPDLDPVSFGDVIYLYLALGENTTALRLLPKFCAAAPAGCSELSVNPLWLSLHGQPAFEALVKKYDTISKPAVAATATPATATSTL